MAKFRVKWRVQTRSDGGSTISEARIGDVRISIHNYHGLPITTWFVSCHEIGIDRLQLDDDITMLDDAQIAGFNLVKLKLMTMSKLINEHQP